MRRKRPLTAEERQLWQRLTRSVTPLASKTEMRGLLDAGEKTGKPTADPAPSPKPRRAAVQRQIVGTSPDQRPSAPRPQSLSEAGDPRQARHVSRGRRPIDATLDLHGLTQEQAFVSLSRFLTQARAIGHATVLVITGKGAPQDRHDMHGLEPARGILRRRFLDWAEGPFRDHIASIRQSHQRHGGAGAFYVFLKKQH